MVRAKQSLVEHRHMANVGSLGRVDSLSQAIVVVGPAPDLALAQ
ncbi:hypothetical protein ACRCUN_10875 [Mycobacterium sp. LTG2003]